MKKIIIFIAFIVLVLTIGCEEVIPVDLNTDPPKLVVEAILKWQNGTQGNNQTIKLSTTASYFSNVIPAVSGAKITVKNSQNTVFDFVEGSVAGQYNCENFIPKLDETYTLSITLKGEIYTATEVLKSVALIDRVEQNDKGGINKDKIQLKTFFKDPANVDNFYLYNYAYENKIKEDFFADDDVSFKGNEFFSISRADELKKGDKVTITHYGISERYFNFMKVLISIAGQRGGGPFEAPPVTLRGNVVNTTNIDNYPLGYFYVGQTDVRTEIIK